MKKFLFVLFSCLTLGSCEYKCDEFPQFMEEYLPYQMGQIVNFENNNGELIEFIVTERSVYQPLSNPSLCKCDCTGEVQASLECCSDDFYAKNIVIFFTTMMRSRNVSNGVSLSVSFYSGDHLTCRKSGFDPYKEKNGNMVESIIEIRGEGNFTVDRIKIERGKGLVEFDDVINNCTWKLVE